MKRTPHTHRGHCQACGRLQAVDNAAHHIATHGYTVDNGYFNGTCGGSNFQPLEVSHTLLDSFVSDCFGRANGCDARIDNLTEGRDYPPKVNKLKHGQRVYTYETNRRGRRETVYTLVKWADATDAERAEGLKHAIYDLQREAKFMRYHAETLIALKARVHGQPLKAVAKSRVLEIGDTVTLVTFGLSDAPVLALRTMHNSRGQPLRQAQFARGEGRTVWVSLRSIRDFKKKEVPQPAS